MTDDRPASGRAKESIFLGGLRPVVLTASLWLFTRVSLDLAWYAYLFTDTLVALCGVVLYIREVKTWKEE